MAESFVARHAPGPPAAAIEAHPSYPADPLPNFFKDMLNLQALAFLFSDAGKQRSLRNRQAMLKLVRDFWIEGVLKNSLPQAVMLELGLVYRPQAVDAPPWAMLGQTAAQSRRSLPPGLKLIEIFNHLGQSLLILGEPGSGKTTMLLSLAQDLLALADQDPTQPIPVVFNLVSWAETGASLAEWLIEELHLKYRIPRRIARVWVENDELLPLLDGLDEVAGSRRDACVLAINRFQAEHLTPLVVCSRAADYDRLATRLTLRGAIVLQPLTGPQIDHFF